MKKTYWNTLGVNHAAKIVSRRLRHVPFANISYKTDANPDPADPADTRTEDQLLAAIQTKIDTALATRATTAELDAIRTSQREALHGLDLVQLRAMADDKTGVTAQMAQMALRMQKLEQTSQAGGREDLSLRGQIRSWQEKNKDKLESIKSGTKVDLPPLEIRAVASPMGVATVNPAGSPYIGRVEVEPGINDFIRAQPIFWDYLTKGRTNAPTYVWVNKTNPQGAAAFIGPGVLKPGVSFELVADNSVAKKIADSAKATTELLQDIDGMETFIEQELRYQVMIKVNSTLMNSVGTNTVPTGIQQLSTTYTLTSVHTTNPTEADVIRAVVAQLRSGWLTGPITVFMNSIDSANMDLQKAQDSGVYLLPPFVTSDGRKIGGATIVEDNNVPVGYFQAALLRYYRILIYKGFSVSWGWENDDFTRNLVTAVGEMRLHQFFNQNHTGAFIYDTFANVMAALEA